MFDFIVYLIISLVKCFWFASQLKKPTTYCTILKLAILLQCDWSWSIWLHQSRNIQLILTIVKLRHNSGSWIGQYLKGFLSNIVHQKPLTREDVNWYNNQQYIDSENITLYVFGMFYKVSHWTFNTRDDLKVCRLAIQWTLLLCVKDRFSEFVYFLKKPYHT